MRIGIRVDASLQMGIGHLRRCLSLAQALRSHGASVRFVTRDLGVDSVGQIAAQGFEDVVLLERDSAPFAAASDIPHAAWAEAMPEADASQTAAALAAFAPDWTVVDSYSFDARWHDALRGSLGCRIAAIDDLADRALAVNLVVDHNLTPDPAEKYAGRLSEGAQLLAGPRFALLGPAFASANPIQIGQTVSSIGVFMGGIDRSGLSAMVLLAIRAAGFAGSVEMVSTTANPALADLQRTVAQDGFATLSLDLPDLTVFFARHQLQVGAGGGASWERCCLGVPTLLLSTADNQQAVVPALADAGAVTTCAPVLADTSEAIVALLADRGLRQHMAERARALVDGRGAERVALAMLADALTVRDATAADSSLIFKWRNHPATRAVSRHSDPIDQGAHDAWFARTLADPDRRLMIGVVGQRPVGAIRLDRVDAATIEVSLYLDPALPGLGLGPRLLAAGERAAAGGLDILAEVLEGNRGSERLFESSGYQRLRPGHYRKPGAQPAGDA